MYLETVKELRQTEEQWERAKAESRAAAQQRLSEAEKAGKLLLEQTRKDILRGEETLRQEAEATAEKRRAEAMQTAEQECKVLREKADGHMQTAVEKILGRVVAR